MFVYPGVNARSRGAAAEIVRHPKDRRDGLGLGAAPASVHTSRMDAPALVAVRIQVELFGVPRLLVGGATTDAVGATLGELAADLALRAPALAGPVLDAATGWPLDGYAFVVDERFTRDPATPLRPSSTVLLVSSVAGG